ncbi:MAG: hypothetical protein LBC31_08410 [Treponema sp.]|nr:hypothetical protein [Treponema sp.]
MSEKIGRRTAFDLICVTYSQFSVPVKKLRNRVPVFTKPGDTNEKAKKAAAMYDVYKDALGYGASPLGGAGEINKRIEEKILPELQQLPDEEVAAILYECRNLARRYELPVRIPDGEIEIVDENTRGLTPSDTGYKAGDQILVRDQSGNTMGEVRVLAYSAIDNGVEIGLSYKDYGSGLTNYNWIQTVTTDMLEEGKTSPFVDVPDGETGPFYIKTSEYDAQVARIKALGLDMMFGDRPRRRREDTMYGTWSAELSLMGKDVTGNYREMVTFGYGFIRDSAVTHAMPLVEREPSEVHQENFP